ncbi:MAG: gfo/Idh/MocA family oxidoreductase [Candidatus Latescibacterota bacterium]|nr:MAG: gfo/Idh/MocA family oxidoreductase [Candidatus Latescibacterota bacterium]
MKREQKTMDKIRWGVLGCAYIARHVFLPALQKTEGSVLTAVASRDRARAEEMARAFGAERFYGSYEDLLDAGDVDAVYIPLPNHLHREYTVKAAQRGIHVLCEKPLAMNEAEATEMAAVCRERGVRLMTCFPWRLDPMHRRAQEIVRSGEIGPIRYMRAGLSFCWSSEDNIRLRPETGGGALMDLGIYSVDMFRWFIGEEPVEVSGTAVTPRLPVDVDETFNGELRFSGDVLGVFVGSFGMRWGGYEIFGERGQIQTQVYDPWHRSKAASLLVKAEGSQRAEAFGAHDLFGKAIAYFTRCVVTGDEPESDGEDGRREMRVVDALVESARTGKRVRV